MQKSDHRGFVYEFIGTQERYLVRQGKRAIRVRAISSESLLHLAWYIVESIILKMVNFTHILRLFTFFVNTSIKQEMFFFLFKKKDIVEDKSAIVP